MGNEEIWRNLRNSAACKDAVPLQSSQSNFQKNSQNTA